MRNVNGHVSLITMRAPEMLSKYDLLTHIDHCLLPPPAACGWVSSYPGNWPPPRPPAPTPATYTAATGRAESQLSAATQQPSTVTSHHDAAETAQPRVRRLQAEPLLHHQLGADQQGRVPQHGPEGGQEVSSEEIAVSRLVL